MPDNPYIAAAQNIHTGYGVDSGFERLEKVAPDTWKFEGEDGVESIHTDREAAAILENVFPGSPAGLIDPEPRPIPGTEGKRHA